MVRFRVDEAPARGEYMVEMVVPAAGGDAALMLVFNSKIAADKAAEFFNKLARQQLGNEIAARVEALRGPEF